MTTKRFKELLILHIVVFAILILPMYAFGQNTNGGGRLNNPLDPQLSTWRGFISGLLKVLVIIALPIVTLAIVYSGAKLVYASNMGKPDDITKAKKGIALTLLGGTLILGAWVIANIIGGTVNQILGGGN